MWRFAVLLALPGMASAEGVVAARTIRAHSVLGPEDVTLSAAAGAGALADPAAALGLEARVTLFAGRPVRPADLGPPTLVERNQAVAIRFRSGALVIEAEGRALARGGAGDTIRVMNLGSRATVLAVIGPDGRVTVGAGP